MLLPSLLNDSKYNNIAFVNIKKSKLDASLANHNQSPCLQLHIFIS